MRSGAAREAARRGHDSAEVPLARAADMEKFYEHLAQVLDEIEFRDRNGSGHLLARLRRLFNRTVLDQNEVNILRGILTPSRASGAAPAIRTSPGRPRAA